MSRTTSAANRGGVAAELRNWAQSTEAAVELLIKACGGRFVDPGQPWLRTDDRGITWLDAQVIARYSHAVSSGERHILALVEALALGKPLEDVGGLMASLDPYHLDLVPAVLRHAACEAGRHMILQKSRRPVAVMTDNGPDRFRCLIPIATARHARPRHSPRESSTELPQPDPGASLAVYPGVSQRLNARRRLGVDQEDDRR